MEWPVACIYQTTTEACGSTPEAAGLPGVGPPGEPERGTISHVGASGRPGPVRIFRFRALLFCIVNSFVIPDAVPAANRNKIQDIDYGNFW